MLTRNQVTLILLYFFGSAISGLALGAVLAKNLMPLVLWQVALFAMVGLSVLVLAVALGLILWRKWDDARQFIDQTPPQQTLTPIRETYPRVLVPMKERKPHLMGSRKTG